MEGEVVAMTWCQMCGVRPADTTRVPLPRVIHCIIQYSTVQYSAVQCVPDANPLADDASPVAVSTLLVTALAILVAPFAIAPTPPFITPAPPFR